MPLYDITCEHCGELEDVMMSISKMETKECPKCGQPFEVKPSRNKSYFRPFVHDNIDPKKDVEIRSMKQWKKELDKRGLVSEYTH